MPVTIAISLNGLGLGNHSEQHFRLSNTLPMIADVTGHLCGNKYGREKQKCFNKLLNDWLLPWYSWSCFDNPEHTHNTKQTNHYRPVSVRSEFGKRMVGFWAPYLYNLLPKVVRGIDYSGLRKTLEENLLNYM